MERLDRFIASVNSNIINPIIILLFTLALAMFIYGIVEFLLNPDNEESKTNGKQHMLWGVVGLTIMIGVFTILNMLMRTFNIQNVNLQSETVEGTIDLR